MPTLHRLSSCGSGVSVERTIGSIDRAVNRLDRLQRQLCFAWYLGLALHLALTEETASIHSTWYFLCYLTCQEALGCPNLCFGRLGSNLKLPQCSLHCINERWLDWRKAQYFICFWAFMVVREWLYIIWYVLRLCSAQVNKRNCDVKCIKSGQKYYMVASEGSC